MKLSSAAISPVPVSSSNCSAIATNIHILEHQADQLVEELFEGVEQVLHERPSLPPQSDTPSSSSPQSTALARIPVGALQPVTTPTQHLSRELRWAEVSRGAVPSPAIGQPYAPPNPSATPDPVAANIQSLRARRILDGLVLGAGGMCLLLTVGIWGASQTGWLQQALQNRSAGFMSTATPNAETDTVTSDPFVDYLYQSINHLDAQPAHTASKPKSVDQPSATTPLPKLPPLAAPNSLPALPAPTASSIPEPPLPPVNVAPAANGSLGVATIPNSSPPSSPPIQVSAAVPPIQISRIQHVQTKTPHI